MRTAAESRSAFSKGWVGAATWRRASRLSGACVSSGHPVSCGFRPPAVERADDSASPTCPRWAGVCRRGFQWGTALLLSSTSFRSPVWSASGAWLPLLSALLYVIPVHLPCLLTTARPLPSSCLLGPDVIDLCVFPHPGRNIWSSWSGFVPCSWSFLLLYSTLPVLFNETRHHFLIISNNFELLLMESLTSNSALKKKKLPFFLPFGWKPVYYVEFRGCQSSWNFFLVWDSLIEINTTISLKTSFLAFLL